MSFRLIVFLLCLMCAVQASAQPKKKVQSTKSAVKKPVQKASAEEVPPEDNGVLMPPPRRTPEATASEPAMAGALPEGAVQINFDTSASPADSFTAKISTLLSVIHALENDQRMMEKSYAESFEGPAFQQPQMQQLKERMLAEVREGRLRRWLERLYIRNYRQLFTPEEVDALTAFYRTDVGQKTLTRQVQLIQNVMTDARKIGAYLGQTLMQEIMAEQK